VRERIVIADGDAQTADVAAFERGRRELLRHGVAFGAAAIAASSIPLLLSLRDAFAAQDSGGDDEILQNAIALEQVVVIAYDMALASRLLSPAALRVARRLRSHERQHVDALTTALTDLGGTPPAPPEGIGDVDKVADGLRDARTQADVVNVLIELELAAVGAYHDAQARLVETRLLQTSASIMASDGQHLVVLRGLVGADPVPKAFETGTT
jgi:hypothetical protein